MAKKGKSAYGAPAEEKEMVVTIDRRLILFGLLPVAVLLFGGLGYWMALRGSGPATVANTTGAAGGQAAAAAAATAQVRAEMIEAGLDPDKVQVIGQESMVQPLDEADIPPELLAPVESGNLPPDAQQMMDELGGQEVDVTKPNSADASKWPHDVLANFEDPNVTNPDYVPVRPEDVKEPLEGPRLGITDLNTIYTYDFGVVPMDEPVNHDFTAQNVGDEDLIISRVYTGCGCTATKINDTIIDAAGWLPEPLTLKPGETAKFTVEFDPRAEGRAGAQSKFIQIYSNDPTKAMFDPQDPLSHETRFRIVVEPKFGVTWESIRADEEAEGAESETDSDANDDEG